MIEFAQNYGLWIALAGIFIAMHWFGRGCCGGRQRQGRGTEGVPDQALKGEKPSEAAPKSSGICH
jgi:hypothetical protein